MRLVVAICLAVVSIATTALAESRVALVVGNSRYQLVPSIANAQNDSRAIAALLRGEGFDVEEHQNLGNESLRRAVREFVSRTRQADVALVYFAGHGIEMDGMNYLIPVDARLQTDLDVQDEAVSLDRVLQVLEPASKLRLIILDACRDNPFLPAMKRTLSTRAVSRGLAKVEPSWPNTLIAFAAKAGSTADDGDGAHSPFTGALLKHIAEPGLDIRLALGRVRDEVLGKTRNAQEPFVYGSLGGSVVTLSSKVPAPPWDSAGDGATDEARKDFAVAQKLGTLDGWDTFLSRHAHGYVSDLARRERQRLAARTDQPKASEPAAPPQPAPPRAGGAFAADDRERVAQIAARNGMSLPSYEISPVEAEVGPAVARFVGVWASRIGYNDGAGRQMMLIGTSVTKDGLLRGLLVGGAPTDTSINRQPAYVFPFVARIKGGAFSFHSAVSHRVVMTRAGTLRMTDSGRQGTFSIDLEPVWLAGDPAAGADLAALQPAEALQDGGAANDPFDAAARARVSAIAARHKLPLPEYGFDQSGRKTPPELKKFIGVWASVVGYNGSPVQGMMIVTDVNEAGEADGHMIVGPSSSRSPVGARPARRAPFRGPVVGGRLSFATPRSTVDATMTAGNTFQVKVVEVSGRVVRVELLPVWTLLAGLAPASEATAPAAPATRTVPKRALPAVAAPGPSGGSVERQGRGSRGGGRGRGGGGAIMDHPRFPMCARMASQRGLTQPNPARRSFVRNCVSSG